MKKLSRILALVLCLAMAMFLVACGNTAAPAEEAEVEEAEAAGGVEDVAAEGDAAGLKIGATYYSLQNEFTMRMDNQAKKWAEANGVEYTGYDGDYNAATQLQQVETMIADGVDAIVLNPQDADACAACVDAAVAAGIPIVGVNTMVNSDDLTSYCGSQDVSAGEDIMQYMIDYIGNDEFNIVVIEGPMGQSAQLQRWEGINNILADHPNVKILAVDTANWSRSEAMTLMETWLTTYWAPARPSRPPARTSPASASTASPTLSPLLRTAT